MNNMQWYFKYDPTTFEFIPGAVLTDTQPANSTPIDPATFGYLDPKFNPNTNTWTGTQTQEDYYKQLAENAPKNNQTTDNNQQIAMLSQQVMMLMSKLSATTVTPTVTPTATSTSATPVTPASATTSTSVSASASATNSTTGGVQ